jgi:hypothetical protein
VQPGRATGTGVVRRGGSLHEFWGGGG